MSEAGPWVVHVHLSPQLKQKVTAELIQRRGTAQEIFLSGVIEQALELWLQREHGGAAGRLAEETTGDWPARFLASRCMLVEGAAVTSHELYMAYIEWAEEHETWAPVSRIAFGRAMRREGLASDNGRGNVLIWPNLALRRQEAPRG